MQEYQNRRIMSYNNGLSAIRIIQIILILFCGLLQSCASMYNIKTTAASRKYAAPTHIANDFDISGRFFIKSPTKKEYGNFTWFKTPTLEELAFTTPLGETVARFKLQNGVAIFTTDKNSYTGHDIDQLMQQNLGYVLPLEKMHYWIQGVAVPAIPVDHILEKGFSQFNWNIEYLEWADNNHPKIIQISNNTLDIKLLINW